MRTGNEVEEPASSRSTTDHLVENCHGGCRAFCSGHARTNEKTEHKASNLASLVKTLTQLFEDCKI